MDYIMETVGLRKAYKDNIVVDDVNMHISKGAIYGFVGPNGAGKSTVMKMILSLIQPDAGEVQLLGEKVTSHSYEIFKKVGSIIENPYFYDKMTARQNLELHCEYMGFPNKERIDEVLHLVDLQNVEKKQVCHYSLGMKQRLAIARAILAKPEFLIMGFSLLSPLEFFVDPKNVDGRNNKPPAMRVRVDCYTKKLPFRVQ